MRIDFSEPECSTCYHYRTSGILNTHQEPEPNNVIAASSLNPIPVSSEPVQDLGSTSTSISSVPAQSLGPQVTFGASTTSNSTTSSSSSPIIFGSPPPHALNQPNIGYQAFFGYKSPRTGSIQAPVQASTSSFVTPHQDFGKTASMFGNGGSFARTDIGYVPNHLVPSSTSTVVFGTTPVSISSVCNPTTPKNPFGLFGFGLPGFSDVPTGLINYPRKNSDTTQGNMTGFGSFPSGYAPTLDGLDKIKSISASNAYQKKSHEELRWEDYKQGNKGTLFAPADISLFGSTSSATSPSIFASKSIPYHPNHINLERREETNAPFTLFLSSSSPISTSLSVQRPQETIVVSSPPSSGCCTACGVTTRTTSSSLPPSSVATSVSGLFSTSASSSADMSGTTNLATQGKNPGLEAFGKNLVSRGTQTPAVEAYPTMSGTNLAAQTTTTRAFQAYPTRYHRDADLFHELTLLICLSVCFFMCLMLLF